MDARALDLAARVIRKSGPGKPSDLVLRLLLREERQADPRSAREVALTVFAYHRWQGLVDSSLPLPKRIVRAAELNDAFRQNHSSVKEGDLLRGVVPSWVAAEMPVELDWLRALQSEPVLWLRARSGRAMELARDLGASRANPEEWRDAVLYSGEGDLFRSPLFHAGAFEIQDISSQAVGWICAPRPGETWWDTCAGEGGKMLHLSDLMQNRGLIWASDKSAARLDRLRKRAARAKVFNYRVAAWDGGAKLPTRTRFDGVLVDAPCSGIGTWQRNPQARWTTTLDDVAELAVLQLELLRNAARLVKPGGRLIYSVCTLTRSETTGVVEAFEAGAEGEFEAERMVHPFAPTETTSRLLLWPQETGGNGMFIAAWRRVK